MGAMASVRNVRSCVRGGALMLAAALLLGSTPSQASLVVNGSFEAPLSPVGFYVNYPVGSTAITGWTVVGIDSSVVEGTFTQRGITFQAQDGNQWIDLAGVDSNSTASGVTQDINTVAGQLYEISFWVGSATDGLFFFPTTVDLSIDGGARQSFTNPTAPNNMLNWKQFTLQFTASGPTTNITFYNGGASNNFNTSLDNVVVEAVTAAVPEATSLMVWSVVALSAGGFRLWRVRKSA